MKGARAAAAWARRRRHRRLLTGAGSALLGAVLLIWSLLPIYNLFLIALDPEEGEVEFTGNIVPPEPSNSSARLGAGSSTTCAPLTPALP